MVVEDGGHVELLGEDARPHHVHVGDGDEADLRDGAGEQVRMGRPHAARPHEPERDARGHQTNQRSSARWAR